MVLACVKLKMSSSKSMKKYYYGKYTRLYLQFPNHDVALSFRVLKQFNKPLKY